MLDEVRVQSFWVLPVRCEFVQSVCVVIEPCVVHQRVCVCVVAPV